MYSSETGAWSAQTHCSNNTNYYHAAGGLKNSSLLIGNTLYFTLAASFEIKFLKYDLVGGHGLSLIEDTPPGDEFPLYAPVDVDGELGIVQSVRDVIYTFSGHCKLVLRMGLENGCGEMLRRKQARAGKANMVTSGRGDDNHGCRL